MGLEKAFLSARPTTSYLMLDMPCNAGCLFCSHAHCIDKLSRVDWPIYPVKRIFKALQNSEFKRICIQCPRNPGLFDELKRLLPELKKTNIPISISAPPFKRGELEFLTKYTDRIAVNLDAATPELLERFRPAYSWDRQSKALRDALAVFGKGNVSCHLIAGLGETEEQMARIIQELHDMGVVPSLFAFTPLPGTPSEKLPRPALLKYRRLQLIRHLIVNDRTAFNYMSFKEGEIFNFDFDLKKLKDVEQVFTTAGCPGCNRPYYNEEPGGVIYNFPEALSKDEAKAEILRVLEG